MTDPAGDVAEPQPEQRVTVTVADDQVADTGAVAGRLRSAGMNVEQVLDAVGVVIGSVPAEQRQSLEAVPGVAAVEDETTFQIAPPDSEVQ